MVRNHFICNGPLNEDVSILKLIHFQIFKSTELFDILENKMLDEYLTIRSQF